jgi:hypothetical protein
MRDEENALRRERLHRQLAGNRRMMEEQEANLRALSDPSDPERAVAARERLARRDRESAERLADEYRGEGRL